ncbi:hypothetical protein [Alkalibacterium sp. s-m-28]
MKTTTQKKDLKSSLFHQKVSMTERERLPETATVTWTVGLVGLGSIASGTAAHFIKKK